jgi:hypothetical protein
LFCCGGALLITAAMVLDPGTLLARVKSAKDDAAAAEARREFTDTLATLLSQCHEILAVHQRGATPYAEIVVWKSNAHNPAQIDPEEIAIISHSDLLQAVTIYSLPEGGPPNVASSNSNAAPFNAPTLSPLRFDRVALEQPGFCDRWRALPAVQPRVIGSGISDMTLTPAPADSNPIAKIKSNVSVASGVGDGRNLPRVEGSRLSTLRLCLRWASDSSDATETSGVIIANAPSSGS